LLFVSRLYRGEDIRELDQVAAVVKRIPGAGDRPAVIILSELLKSWQWANDLKKHNEHMDTAFKLMLQLPGELPKEDVNPEQWLIFTVKRLTRLATLFVLLPNKEEQKDKEALPNGRHLSTFFNSFDKVIQKGFFSINVFWDF